MSAVSLYLRIKGDPVPASGCGKSSMDAIAVLGIYICLDFELVINYIMHSRGGAYDEGGHHLRSV